MTRTPASRWLLVCASAASLVACGEREHKVTIDAGGPVVSEVPVAPTGTSAAERLGVPAPEQAASSLDYTAPGGWQALPPAPMREAGFRAGDAEVTLSVFPGATGGLLANVNRWRTQMSLPPIAEADLAALPRRPMLRGEATYVELTGRYVGMGGTAEIADAKLVGLVRGLPAASVFVKMVGPAKAVDAQADPFRTFCESIRMRGMPGPAVAPDPGASAHAPSAGPSAEGKGEGGGLRWTWPAGWSRSAKERPMRAATIVVASAPSVDVALTVLAGDGGGLVANINRWRGQMGQPALSDADIEALPRVPSLGGKAVVVSIDGAYTGMDGATIKDSTLLGAVIERESDVVFVKATGPKADVGALRPAFEAFLGSLEGGGK